MRKPRGAATDPGFPQGSERTSDVLLSSSRRRPGPMAEMDTGLRRYDNEEWVDPRNSSITLLAVQAARGHCALGRSGRRGEVNRSVDFASNPGPGTATARQGRAVSSS